MQVFANGKRRFHSFIEFYVINLKNQEANFDHSGTLMSDAISKSTALHFSIL